MLIFHICDSDEDYHHVKGFESLLTTRTILVEIDVAYLLVDPIRFG